MRKNFEPQLLLGTVGIGDVEIDQKSRDELPPVLAGLQHIFVTPELNEEVFSLLEEQIVRGNKEVGRPGMSLWEVFVLGVVRLCLDINYDRLVDQANNHITLRGILGVRTTSFGARKKYCYQTVVDNLTLLDEATLQKINEVIVKSGHRIIKKKKGPRKRK